MKGSGSVPPLLLTARTSLGGAVTRGFGSLYFVWAPAASIAMDVAKATDAMSIVPAKTLTIRLHVTIVNSMPHDAERSFPASICRIGRVVTNSPFPHDDHWHHVSLLRRILLRMRSQNYIFLEGH
jgi:hypothetical protein